MWKVLISPSLSKYDSILSYILCITLAGAMEKIQNYIMQDTEQDKTASVDETLAISKLLPPLARISREVLMTYVPRAQQCLNQFSLPLDHQENQW